MYLGRNPAVGTQRMLDSLELQFNGTLTTFDLRYGGVPIYPTLSESLIVSLGGVLQEPGEAFYVSSDRIVFSEAPPAGAECWILLYSQYGASVTSSTSSPVIQATGEPMGFENRTHSSISFDNATRTFSIAPNTTGGHSSYVVWTKGTRRVVSTTQSVQVGTSTGLYYIYFDANGDIQYKTTYFTWDTETMVAYVYWNSGTSSAPFIADERHGVVLDWQTHEYLHRTRGAVIAEGFSISAYTTTGNGNVDAHAQFDLGNGTFFDEDLEVNITHSATPTTGTFTQVLTGGAEIPVFYMSGSAGAWVRDSATKYACKQSATTLQYNLLSGSTWSTTPANDNRYVVSWIVATNDITAPVICILGQDQYTAIGIAEEAKFGDLVLTNFPIVEFRPLWKVIFQTSTGFTNTPNALIANILDLRRYSESSISGTIISDHGLLSGLADDDHSQYLHTSLDRVGITANISTTGNLGGANLTLTGELRGPSTLIIDPAAIGDNTGTVEIKGNLTVQGTTTTINSTTINVTNLKLEDNEKLYVGTGDDLQIYHNGSNSYIKHNGTGNLYTDIGAADYYQITNSETETIASFQADGAVELYHNGSKKFETTSSGITITGNTYSNGRIGVGTSTPQALLEVNLTGVVANTTNSTDSSTWGPNGIVNLYNSNGSTTGSEVLLLGSQAGGVGQLASGFGFGRESGADWGTYISFKTHSTSTSNIDELYERVRITSVGNVGIGSTNPTSKLDVVGSIIASGSVSAAGASGFYSTTFVTNARNPIWRFANADGYGLSYFQGSAGVSPAGGGDTIGFHFGTPTAVASLLQLNNGSGAVINGTLGVTGNVGIGTTAPVSKLEVAGIVSASSGLRTLEQVRAMGWWGVPTGSSYSGLGVEMGVSGGAGYVLCYNRDSSTYGTLNIQSGSTVIQLPSSGSTINVTGNIDASGIVRATGGRLVLRDDSLENHATDTDTASVVVNYAGYASAYTRFRDFHLYNGKAGLILKAIGSSGNVGIGSASPTSKLDVVGTVTATNFGDATGGYNVNLGSGGSEGRGLVAGYSGGSYGGIGYNVRHTTTGGTYIAPFSDTSNYILFNQGFTFLGDTGGSAVRTISYNSLARIDNSGNFLQTRSGSYHRIAYSSSDNSYSSTQWWNGLALGNNGDNYIVAGRTATGGQLKFYVNNTNDITSNTTPGGTLALLLGSNGNATFGGTVGIGITPISPLTIAAASTQDNAVYQSWVYSPGNENAYRLDLKQTVTSGVVRYNFSMINNGTSYTDVLVLDRGNVGIGSTNPAHKLDVAGNIRLGGQLAAAATATPAYLSLGTSFSSTPTRANCKIRLYDNGADVYGFNIGVSGDVQYHSTTTHQFYNNDSSSAIINSTGIYTGRDIYVSGRTGGSYGNRLVVGATDTSYTLQDSNLRPTIQANGAYPVLSLNHTVTGNTSHGPTIQFTCSGTGHQFVIGTTGNGARMDIGFSSTGDWNPHNGISGYQGTTTMSFDTSGNVGIGTRNPAYKLEVNGSFAATTKSFIIPHPTKEGYKLRHGSLEGPENGVYVRGRGDSAIIELPEYWTGLVDSDSITVNLTPIGQNSPLWVERIEDNKVYVGREDTSVSYFYTIFAERIDVLALDVEIKIEEEDE